MARPVRSRIAAASVALILTAAASLTGLAARPVLGSGSITGLYFDGPGIPADGVPVNVGASAAWTASVGADPSVLYVNVSGANNSFGFQFASAPGSTLTTGSYVDAVRAAFRTAGQNGVDISFNNYGCSTLTGSFTVLELTKDGSGTVTAAAVDFEIHCESQAPAIFGSIRFQSSHGYRGIAINPVPYPPPLSIGATVVGGTVSRNISFTSTGTDPLTISSVNVTGTDFSLASQDCTGSLAAGTSCTISVAFTPSALGGRAGDLTIGDDALPSGHVFGIAGAGLASAIDPTSIDFGTVDLYTSGGTRPVTLHNGPNPLTGISFSIASQHLSFSVVSATCGTTLAAGASCTVSVRYLAQYKGADSGYLNFQANEVGGFHTTLTGIGRAGTKIAWGSTRGVGRYRWNDGASLARTTTSTAAYLHSVSASAVVGSKVVTDSGPYEPILYSRSANGGATWGAGFRVNPTTQHGDRPTIAASGAYLYVGWVRLTRVVRYSPTTPRVLYVRVNRAHGSATAWGTIHRITSLTGRIDFPVIAASGASAYVVWTDASTGAIRIAASHDHGSTWHTTTLGTTASSSADGRGGYPSVAVYGNRITVAWTADANGAIKARTSTTAGSSWGATSTLTTSSTGLASVAARGTRSAVAWTSGRTLHLRIQAGTVWGVDQPTTPPGSPSYYSRAWFPVVALQGSTGVAVAYSACVATCPATSSRIADLIWAESTNGGGTWASQVIGFYLYGAGSMKIAPSVVWASPTLRYVMWNGIPVDAGLGLYIRTGSGAP